MEWASEEDSMSPTNRKCTSALSGFSEPRNFAPKVEHSSWMNRLQIPELTELQPQSQSAPPPTPLVLGQCVGQKISLATALQIAESQPQSQSAPPPPPLDLCTLLPFDDAPVTVPVDMGSSSTAR